MKAIKPHAHCLQYLRITINLMRIRSAPQLFCWCHRFTDSLIEPPSRLPRPWLICCWMVGTLYIQYYTVFKKMHIYIYGTPPKKPTFGHFLTVFTVFCHLFRPWILRTILRPILKGDHIYIYIYIYWFFVCLCTRGVCVCVCVSDLMCSDKVLRRY